MRILSVRLERAPFTDPVKISTVERGGKSWITVLVGKNSTRKSVVLRALAELGRGNSRYSPYGHSSTKLAWELQGEIPTKVIAVANTPWDRFQRAPWWERWGDVADDRYVYLGQRSSGGLVSERNLEVHFAMNLLRNSGRLGDLDGTLGHVLAPLGIRHEFGIRFRINPALEDRSFAGPRPVAPKRFESAIENLGKRLASIKGVHGLSQEWIAVLEEYVRLLQADSGAREALMKLLNQVHASKIAFWLNKERHVIHYGFGTVVEWRRLLELDLVRIDGVSFRKTVGDWPETAREAARDSDLSSGQWSWLYTFTCLAFELRPRTLVLVDEPENSLHPAWQRKYARTLAYLLEQAPGSHAIVATHSAIVASSLPREASNVMILRRQPETDLTEAVPAIASFGWGADDVLKEIFEIDSARSPELIDVLNRYLGLYSRDQAMNPVPGDREMLLQALAELPGHDPMRNVVTAILGRL